MGKGAFAILFLLVLPFNGQSRPLKNDEGVVVFPAYAYAGKDRQIRLHFHAWIFEPEATSPWRQALIHAIQGYFPARETAEEDRTLQKRLRGFIVDNERSKALDLRLGTLRLQPGSTGSDGHVEANLNLKLSASDRIKLEQGALPLLWDRGGQQNPLWISRDGLSVISDIDDTIKTTQVLDRKAMVLNSFTRDFSPVTGMPELYAKFATKGAVFHYVSASPWQLFPDLHDFLQKNFPNGTVSLRKLRLKDSSGLEFLWGDSMKYKVETIAALILAFPQRKFILIGDSGEKDPEVYEEIRQRFPAQIVGILIRIPPEQKETQRKAGMEYFRDPKDIAPALQRWGIGD